MSRFLPIFPLNLVVFPGEQLNLHIFEPRYRQLIQDCKTKGLTFGIPPFIDNKMQETGTELKLLSIEEMYDDGKMDIKTEGVGLFEVQEFQRKVENKLYSGAIVVDKNYSEVGGDVEAKKLIYERIKELFKFMNIHKVIPTEYDYILTFRIAQHVGFNIYQKYEMLQIESESARQKFMIDHLNKLLPVVKEMELLKQRIQMNGHFKNIVPPKF